MHIKKVPYDKEKGLIFMSIEIKKFKGGFDRNFSYIVYDTESKKSIVVDPIIKEEIPSFIEENKLDLAYVLNTHGHFDHVEGNGKILDLTGAKLFDPAKKNEKVGPISIKVIPTPGHTKDSVCYLINKKWLFTGDTLFVGKIGGTSDLKSAKEEFESLKKIMMLDEKIIVYPGHDYGKKEESTIGEEKNDNPFIQKLNSFDKFLDLKENWAQYKKEHVLA